MLFAIQSSGWTLRQLAEHLHLHVPVPSSSDVMHRRLHRHILRLWHHGLRHVDSDALCRCVCAWSYCVHHQRADVHRWFHSFLTIPLALRWSVPRLADMLDTQPHPDGLLLLVGSLLARDTLTLEQGTQLLNRLEQKFKDPLGFALAVRRLFETLGDVRGVLWSTLPSTWREHTVFKAFVPRAPAP